MIRSILGKQRTILHKLLLQNCPNIVILTLTETFLMIFFNTSQSVRKNNCHRQKLLQPKFCWILVS